MIRIMESIKKTHIYSTKLTKKEEKYPRRIMKEGIHTFLIMNGGVECRTQMIIFCLALAPFITITIITATIIIITIIIALLVDDDDDVNKRSFLLESVFVFFYFVSAVHITFGHYVVATICSSSYYLFR